MTDKDTLSKEELKALYILAKAEKGQHAHTWPLMSSLLVGHLTGEVLRRREDAEEVLRVIVKAHGLAGACRGIDAYPPEARKHFKDIADALQPLLATR